MKEIMKIKLFPSFYIKNQKRRGHQKLVKDLEIDYNGSALTTRKLEHYFMSRISVTSFSSNSNKDFTVENL